MQNSNHRCESFDVTADFNYRETSLPEDFTNLVNKLQELYDSKCFESLFFFNSFAVDMKIWGAACWVKNLNIERCWFSSLQISWNNFGFILTKQMFSSKKVSSRNIILLK